MTAPVLVVEDDLSFREALRRWLETLGHSCVLTESAEQAASEFPKQPFSAVLLDLNLPGRSGHVFLRQLRGVGATTPAIVISGGAQMDDVILAMRNGAADFLRKPFRIDELAAALERALHTSSGGEAPKSFRIAAPAEPATRAQPVAPPNAKPHGAAKAPAEPKSSRLSSLLDRIRTGNVALPVLDSQVGRITRLLSTNDVDLEELQSLVESDANFSATVLRTANSAYYSRGMPAKTMRDAFTRLGSRSVLNVITGAALQARLRVRGPLSSVARSQWINTIATSRFCGELGKILRRPDGERLQLLGLMHNIGEPLFIHLASELDLGGDTESVLAEMPAIHEAAGLALVRSWKMPKDVCRIVGSHHAREAGNDFDFENERFIVLAAWQLAQNCGFTYGPNQSGEPAEALAELGLTEAALEAVCAEAKQWTFD
jgi:HD-like signal output (HDOD) protein/CheY-like chemotaxis protein